jgi:hypothetical protein
VILFFHEDPDSAPASTQTSHSSLAFFEESQVGHGVVSDEGFAAGMVFGKLVEWPPGARIKIHLIEEPLPGQGSV